jgi:hypothetical protein
VRELDYLDTVDLVAAHGEYILVGGLRVPDRLVLGSDEVASVIVDGEDLRGSPRARRWAAGRRKWPGTGTSGVSAPSSHSGCAV